MPIRARGRRGASPRGGCALTGPNSTTRVDVCPAFSETRDGRTLAVERAARAHFSLAPWDSLRSVTLVRAMHGADRPDPRDPVREAHRAAAGLNAVGRGDGGERPALFAHRSGAAPDSPSSPFPEGPRRCNSLLLLQVDFCPLV